MKQTLFETRQKADELLREAVSIWRQSDQVDFLEGIENDPIFSLLMMALAYQANETDSEIERLKEEVLADFVHLLTPYEMGHAIPATVVIKTNLQDDIDEHFVTSDSVFTLSSDYVFMPLLETHVLNAKVRSVVRLDGRRWKVTLDFRHPIKDLSLFSFALSNMNFRDLNITIKGQPLPLVKPWDYSDLPLSSCFALHSMTYNRAQVYNASMLPLDLFARQNVNLFCIDRIPSGRFFQNEIENVDLVFEFSGIADDFLFEKDNIALNAIVLVNAQLHEATLTSKMPVARLAGYVDSNNNQEVTSRQFMHLLQPMDTQIYSYAEVEVRRVAGDRFNQGSLVKLLNCIITKYHSDFYAFQNLRELSTDKLIFNLEEILTHLMDASVQDAVRSVPGVYLLLRQKSLIQDTDFSLSVKYLTTAGAAVNSYLSQTSSFSTPTEFDNSVTRVIAPPVPGSDEVTNDMAADSMLRYYMVTSDRIVTPADIKVFCYKELMTQYGINAKMVKHLSVKRRPQQDNMNCGYEILVNIVLASNSFVKRSFADKIPSVEMMMQKMMEVRSTNIYPIIVTINIEE